MARRRNRLVGAFIPLPIKMVVEEGGLMDRVSGDGFKLFVLALSVNPRENGGFARHGGAQGPRPLTYDMVRRRFRWSRRRVARTIRELIDLEALVVIRPGGLVGAGGTPTLYEIGPAHPWSSRRRQTPSVHGEKGPGVHGATCDPDPQGPSVSMVQPGPRAPRRPASPYVAPSSASRTVRSGSDEPPVAMVEHSTDLPSRAGEAGREPAPPSGGDGGVSTPLERGNGGSNRTCAFGDPSLDEHVARLARQFPDLAPDTIRDKLAAMVRSGLDPSEAARTVWRQLVGTPDPHPSPRRRGAR